MPETRARKFNVWILVRAVAMVWGVYGGVSMVRDPQLRDVDSPPIWIAPICLVLCFGLGFFIRWISKNDRWTERALWETNPFRSCLKFWDQKAFYDPPFYHLGATFFAAAGVTGLAVSLTTRPEVVGMPATILAMGFGIWLGLRLTDFRKSHKTS